MPRIAPLVRFSDETASVSTKRSWMMLERLLQSRARSGSLPGSSVDGVAPAAGQQPPGRLADHQAEGAGQADVGYSAVRVGHARGLHAA